MSLVSLPPNQNPQLRQSSLTKSLAGIVSDVLFWQLVQVGVALSTANLLTLRPLVRGFSIESMFSGLRSRGSLRFSFREVRKSSKSSHRSDEFPVAKKVDYSDSADVEDKDEHELDGVG